MIKLHKMLYQKLYRIKKCVLNKNYYFYLYKRIQKPNLINTAYKKKLCSLRNFSPSIIKWFEDEAYDKIIDYPLDKNSIVMDIGGCKGVWTEKIYNRFNCNIIVYEPVQEYYLIIKNKFANNNKVVSKNYGLGKDNKEVLIEKRDDQSTTFVHNKDLVEKINIKSIQEELSHYNKIDLMSINIEGGEYELLDGILSNNLAHKISNLQIEFHEWFPSYKESHKLRKDIQNKLSITHNLSYCYPFFWESWHLK